MKNFFFGKTIVQIDGDVTLTSKIYPFSTKHAGQFSGLLSTITALVQSNVITDDNGKKQINLSLASLQEVLSEILLTQGIALLDECVVCEFSQVGEDGKVVEESVKCSEVPHFFIPDIVEGFVSVNFTKGRWKKWVNLLDKPLEKLLGKKNFLLDIVLEFLQEMESQSETSS